MAFNLGSISVRLLADGRQFTRTLQRSERTLAGFARSAKVAGGIAVAAIAGMATKIATHQTRLNEEARNWSVQLNKNAEDLSALRHVADKINVPFSQFMQILQRVNRRAGDASEEGKNLARAFAQVGVDADKFLELGAIEQVAALTGKFSELGDVAARQSRLFKLLDAEGQVFARTTQFGAAGILELTDAARQYGAASQDSIDRTQRWQDELDKLKLKAEGASNRLLNWGADQAGKGIARIKGVASSFWEKLTTPPRLLEQQRQAEVLVKAKEAQAKAAEKAARAEQANVIAVKATISEEKKRAILARVSQGMGRAVNAQTEFLGMSQSRTQRPQEVRSRQLDGVNRRLDSVIGLLRNNATGATVTFAG